MSTGIGPYVTPDPTDTDPSVITLETTIVAAHAMVDIGGGIMVHAETFNGAIPGPTFRLNVNDTVIVRLVNELDHPTGIHWHGIELPNSSDGTEVTQDGALPMFPVVPPAPAPAGGTYLYKFKVPRPGLYWYHPHHHLSTNRVFRGMYGMIVVADPNEAALIATGVLPGAADTKQLVLSDITVCKAPGSNDAATYVDPTTLPVADRAEWLSGATSQPAPTPVDLCEIAPAGSATNDDGSPAIGTSYTAGHVPSMVRTGRINEGQTVLTNGVNVGGRLGTPSAPRALAPDAQTLNVLSGQGLRLQIANCAITRYFRLILTTSTGAQVPLVRIGGEGGLLDNAVVEGGVISGFDSKYQQGEIVLPAGSRADVVAAVPAGLPIGSVLTLWTRDFQRNGALFSAIPTVPVMHLTVTGSAGAPYTIGHGSPLRASIPGAAVEALGPATGVLLDPATFASAKLGMSNQDIQLTNPPSIDGVIGMFEGTPYTTIPHINSSRYAEPGHILDLTITNQSGGHHPFHLHGFSIQPISLTMPGFPTFTWPYREFRDNVDVPPGYTLTFKVRIDDRQLKDGMTLGGALGRWLFHCHIFLHHHQGMISELVVTAADGSEKPNVDVAGSWAYTPSGGIAQRHGTFSHPDGDAVSLTASFGTVTPMPGGAWSWQSPIGASDQITYVYITATDSSGRKDQAAFRLKIGPPDDGSDNGDPHIHTIDGKRYDFQAVGEFILLRDREGMEIQARQTPVLTANPITDPYTGLKSCVSINTAVAARVGTHQISYQPGKEQGQLQFFVDGKPAQLSTRPLDLDGHIVSGFEVNGTIALRVDYLHYAVLIVTPHFWTSHNMWYLNISISHTQADEGLMGIIPKNTWLPLLPSGASVGPMPRSLHERFITLYKTFADAWRVTDQSSLFVYELGTSSSTFTDKDWPAEKPPCKLKPQFEIPGVSILEGMDIDKAKQICQLVTEDGLHQDCVFDVATTGEEVFAEGYRVTQEIRQRSTAVQIVETEKGVVTAVVSPLIGAGKQPKPKGTVIFFVNNKEASQPLALDEKGQVQWKIPHHSKENCKIKANFTPADITVYYPSSSPNVEFCDSSSDHDHGVKKSSFAQPWYVWVVLTLIVLLPMFSSQLKKILKKILGILR